MNGSSPHLNKGTFLLSIDTELAWGGIHDGSFRRRQQMFERTRRTIAGLIQIMERYEIRATWAIVGHLFLESCKPSNGVKHPEIVRPSYPWRSGDWFEDDPCGDVGTDQYWYGPDIVESILKCRVPQEIGSHGFSHVIVGDPGCSRECFDSELKACVEVARAWGITLRSFVYPRNSIGHLDVLAANGFTAYRGLSSAWHQRLPGPARRVGRGADYLLPVPVVTAQPRRAGDLWDLPATCFYLHRDGWARGIPVALRVYRSVLGVRRAAREKSLYHLWFHPFNLASDPDGLLGGLEAIFKEVARLRELGVIENLAMMDMVEHLETTNIERFS